MEQDPILTTLQDELDGAVTAWRDALANNPGAMFLHEIDAAAKLRVLNTARGYAGLPLVSVEGLPDYSGSATQPISNSADPTTERPGLPTVISGGAKEAAARPATTNPHDIEAPKPAPKPRTRSRTPRSTRSPKLLGTNVYRLAAMAASSGSIDDSNEGLPVANAPNSEIPADPTDLVRAVVRGESDPSTLTPARNEAERRRYRKAFQQVTADKDKPPDWEKRFFNAQRQALNLN